MQRVLVAVDFSASTEAVLRVAEELARALGTELRLVHVAAPEPEFVGYEVDSPALRDTHAAAYREEHRRLQELGDGLRAGGADVKALLIQGPTVEKILEEAERFDAGIVVLGSHGRGLGGGRLGLSTRRRRHGRCSDTGQTGRRPVRRARGRPG